jgi:cysteine-rich repeat protein
VDFGDGDVLYLPLCLKMCSHDDECPRDGYACLPWTLDQRVCYPIPECGNGQQFGEECDDGNQQNGDGCSASCTLEVCDQMNGPLVAQDGDNAGNTSGQQDLTAVGCSPYPGREQVWSYTATVDGAVDVHADSVQGTSVSFQTDCGDFTNAVGCLLDARAETGSFAVLAGQQYFLVVEQSVPADYVLTLTPVPQRCGDGIANGTEPCDGTDVRGGACEALAPSTFGELGCTADCTSLTTDSCAQPMTTDVEPNNTFQTAQPYGEPFVGALVPGTDIDCVSLPVQAGQFVRAEVLSLSADACTDGTIDAVLTLRDPNGDPIAGDQNACASIPEVTALTSGNYVACVESDNGAGFSYRLRMSARSTVCGDNRLEGDELCDRTIIGSATCFNVVGSATGRVTCNATCNDYDTSACVPLTFTEVEPNNAPLQANIWSPGFLAQIDPIADLDCVSVQAEIHDVLTIGVTDIGDGGCRDGIVDPEVVVFGPDLVSAEAEETPGCASFELLVQSTGTRAVCVLGITVHAPVCGDGLLDVGEVCDDGNVNAGDGCSPACTNEACDGATTVTTGAVDGDTASAPMTNLVVGCSSGARQEVYRFTAPSQGRLSLTLNSDTDQGIALLSTCGDGTTELGCADQRLGGDVPQEQLQVDLSSGEQVTLVVSPHQDNDVGPFVLLLAFD